MTTLRQKLLALTSDNLWWTWHGDVRGIFRDIDFDLYLACHENPLLFLQRIDPARLEQRAHDADAESRIDRALRRLREHVDGDRTWASIHAGALGARPVAYFCMEYGIHEALPIYSGGLGILAGDHLKAASDLGVPMVALGLLYHEGYTRQVINAELWQDDVTEPIDVAHLPLRLARGHDGEPIKVSVEMPGRVVVAQVHEVGVGRVRLLLLDPRDDANAPEDRVLGARLYGGDHRMRIQQELLLGVGGMRALRALGITPSVLHLNEGHCAFAVLERARHRVQVDGLDPERAIKESGAATVFTTHTPVEAGHDRFEAGLAAEHLGHLAKGLGVSVERLMNLGKVVEADEKGPFLPTVLALKTARRVNGVSALHGQVSRAMWQQLHPARREEEVPIGHVTNGVHTLSWVSAELYELFRSHLGPNWVRHVDEPALWDRIERIDAAELWETKRTMKARALRRTDAHVGMMRERLGLPPGAPLSVDALTIGFSRRFVPYKRPDLLFSDPDRLDRLVNGPRPINLLFAGRAHPADRPGKTIVQRVVKLCEDPRFRDRIVFIENHNIRVGRTVYHGVDAWLNNPRRPLEACGTSGMKVVLNGGLHLSILDGWWAEAYDGLNGFAIGTGETHAEERVQDQRDADALFSVLEDEVVPLYYDVDARGVPRRWLDRVKRSLRTLAWRFSADRMVKDYVDDLYLPAALGSSRQMPPP